MASPPTPVSARALARGHVPGAIAVAGPEGPWAWPVAAQGRVDVVVAHAVDGPARNATADVPGATGASRAGTHCAWAGGTLVYVALDGRLLAVVPGGPPRVLSPTGKASAPAASPDGRLVAFSVEHDATSDVAVVPVDGSAWPARVSGDAAWCWDPAWSPDGTTLAWHEWDEPHMPWDASRIVACAVDERGPAGPVAVLAGGPDVGCGQPRYSPDGSRVGWVSDATGFANVWVASLDGAGARPLVGPGGEAHEHAEPPWGPGQRSWAWSPDGREIAFNRNEDGFGRLAVAPVDGDGPVVDLSRGWHRGLLWAPGPGRGTVWAVRSGARTPPQLVALAPDGASGSDPARRVVAHGGALGVEDAAVEPELVAWAADDGEAIAGSLYRPVVEPAGHEPLPPLFVWCHGGPTAAAAIDWSPRTRYLVDRGWAVLTPEPRGSTGRGRAYAGALAGRWGEVDVADVVAGIRHAAAAGWCAPGRIAVAGSSSGGLTALLVAAVDPPVVAAVVSAFGVADLFRLAETTHRFERHYIDHLCGPLPAHAAAWKERSPVYRAGSIRVPTLLLQGATDVVVPRAQAEAMAAAVRRRGVEVELHVYEGEGHGWARPATVVDDLERTEAFLRRHVLRR